MRLFNNILKTIENRFTGDSIISIREHLLENVITLFCVFGFLAVIMGGWEVYLQGRPEIVVVYVLAYLPVLASFIFKRHLSYNQRTRMLLFPLYVLAVLILGGVGLSGAGIHLLITFIVLSTTFLGIRTGLISVFISIVAILIIGFGMSLEIIPIDIVAMTNSTRIEAWLVAATLFLIIGGVMVVCPGILQNSLQNTIEIVQEKTSALEESNTKLKKALKEKQEMQERLIQAEKLEAMGLLAAGVAHDLNNTLTGVTTYPEIMLLNMKPEHELYDSLKIIKSSGDKAATIIQDMLTLSRRGVNVKKVLNLKSIIARYLSSPEFDKLRYFHPDVHIKSEIEDNLKNIYGSDVHLFNVVMNLVSNAMEAIHNDGEVKIRSSVQSLKEDFPGYENIPKGEYVILQICDTGSGISNEDLKRIFEPFFTKKKMGRSGTGLGMAIVQGTVKDHQGYIDVQTSEKTGTRITIYFPMTEDLPQSEGNPFDIGKMKGHGEKILFVDDIKEQREIGENVLKDLGYVPICLESGEKAIEYCQIHTPDFLIVDMVMEPGIDGYETLKAIREIHPDLKAIIISGYSETDRVKKSLGLGNVSFLKKPYAVEDFARSVYSKLSC